MSRLNCTRKAYRAPGLHVRVSERAKIGAREMAAKRRVPIHAIVDAAILAYVSPAAQDQRDAMIGKHLNRVSRGLGTLDFNTKLIVAMLRYLIELELSLMPEPASDDERTEIRNKGARRFNRFEQWLASQLVDPENLYQRLQERFSAEAKEFES